MKRAVPSAANLQFSEHFNHRLQSYSIAAGAAGVGLLALAQPANAEIVYTPANITISARALHSYSLDLNQDGTVDFLINATSRESIDQSGGTSRIIARPAQGNGVVGFGGHASALNAGQPIGAGRRFFGYMLASLFTFIGTEFQFHGLWANVKNRYLGLKFQIDGQTHFGWARLSVGGDPLTAKLTGYAYETTANAPIVAGKTSGTDAAPQPSGMPVLPTAAPGATLGALALGAPSLDFWRRRETVMDQIEAG